MGLELSEMIDLIIMSWSSVFLLALYIFPFLIVAKWRKRPVLALIMASCVQFVFILLPWTLKFYNENYSEDVKGKIIVTIMFLLFVMVFYVLILALFQWLVRDYVRRKESPL